MNVRCQGRGQGRRIIAAMAALLGAVACGGSTEPSGGLSGQYDLTLVNGQALPAVYLIYGFGAMKHVTGGGLTFSARQASDIRNLTNTPVNGIPDPSDYRTTPSYQLSGELLIINRPGVPGSPGAYADTGYVDGDVLYVPVKSVDGTGVVEATFTYVKR